jgi:hypothetical protein
MHDSTALEEDLQRKKAPHFIHLIPPAAPAPTSAEKSGSFLGRRPLARNPLENSLGFCGGFTTKRPKPRAAANDDVLLGRLEDWELSLLPLSIQNYLMRLITEYTITR